MKIRDVLYSTVAIAAIGSLTPALAQVISEPVYVAPPAPAAEVYVAPSALAPEVHVAPATPYPGETIYVPGPRSNGAIHGGWVAPGDERLLSDAMGAFTTDARMSGATVTMVANNGELILNGTASDAAQASRMEQLAKRISGGRAIAWFDSSGG